GIALVVGAALVLALLRFRAKPGAPLPVQTRGHTLLEIGWTIAPALVLLVITIPTLHVIFRTQAAPPAQALEVTVLGRQWWWEFRYPTLGLTTANELPPAGVRPRARRSSRAGRASGATRSAACRRACSGPTSRRSGVAGRSPRAWSRTRRRTSPRG